MLLVSVLVFQFTRILTPPRRTSIRTRVTLKAAHRIANFCLKQAGIFIKAAQFLSTVSNLFDSSFTEVFASVQDRVEPKPYSQVRYRFLAEFGVEPEDLYLEFDRNPLAAASLGQVHVARIQDGRKVAVKFLHPNIEGQIRQDMRALRYAVNMILWMYPYLDFRGHLYEFSNMVLAEIDYENEAENMRRTRYNFHGESRVVIPEVIEELSGTTILTTEFIDGISINDIEAIDRAGVDRKIVTELLMEAYARMVFDDRFYHADPHPGNIFVLPSDGIRPVRLGLVDFGAAQNISERMISQMERFIGITRRRDIPSLVDLAVEIGMLAPDSDREAFTNLFELMYARYGSFKIDDYYRINPVRFGRMIKMRDLNAVDLRLRDLIASVRLPRKFIYLGRSLTLLLSLAMRLDERVNVFMIAKPHVEKYLSARPTGISWFLKRKNIQSALGRIAGADFSLPVSPVFGRPHIDKLPPPPRKSVNELILFALMTIGGGFLAAYLDVNGREDAAEWVLFIPAVSFLILIFKSLKK